MPKRICNKRSKNGARFGRVRIGWRKRRMLSQLEELEKEARIQTLSEEAKAKLNEFRMTVRSVLPRNFLRRSQAR